MSASEFSIRDLGPADVEACARLMGASDPWVTLGISTDQARQALATGTSSAVVAESKDGGILGFVRFEARGFIGYHAYIRTVAVDAAARGQRVGETLVKHVEERCAPEAPLMFLFCSSFNTRGQRFYERMGYARVGEVPGLVVPQHGEVLFFKRLRGGGP